MPVLAGVTSLVGKNHLADDNVNHELRDSRDYFTSSFTHSTKKIILTVTFEEESC